MDIRVLILLAAFAIGGFVQAEHGSVGSGAGGAVPRYQAMASSSDYWRLKDEFDHSFRAPAPKDIDRSSWAVGYCVEEARPDVKLSALISVFNDIHVLNKRLIAMQVSVNRSDHDYFHKLSNADLQRVHERVGKNATTLPSLDTDAPYKDGALFLEWSVYTMHKGGSYYWRRYYLKTVVNDRGEKELILKIHKHDYDEGKKKHTDSLTFCK